jgi:hypothetical protein
MTWRLKHYQILVLSGENYQDKKRKTKKHLPIIWAYTVDFTVVQTELEPHIYLGFNLESGLQINFSPFSYC